MKKVLLSFVLFILAMGLSNAQIAVTIHGHVTNSVTSAPIANHPVYINTDSIYNPANGTYYIFSTVAYTNANGYYSVQTTIAANLQVLFYIKTYDCNNVMHMVTGVSTNSPIIANFSICQGPPFLCTASFTYSINNLTVSFSGTATGVAPFSYSWNFGNGMSGTGQFINHTYTTPGLYTVTLTITDAAACVSQSSQNIHVTGQQSCVAMFQIYPDTVNPLTYHFVDASLGNPNYWSWNFGDGSSSTSQNPTHTYNQPGIYLVCLTIGNNTSACQDTYCDSIVVGGNPPNCTASFTSTTNFMTAFFSATATGTAPFVYTWNFGDGSSGTGQNPSHTYNSAGVYLVTLTVVDATSCTAMYSQNVYIFGQNSCIADFICFPDTNNLLTIHFFDISIGNPTSWLWNFGDGTSSTLQNPAHTYAQPGLYNVCLTIQTAPTAACQSTHCDTIHAGASITCQSSFTYSSNNLTVHFSGYSSLPNAFYMWDFGDGCTGTSQNPVHVYSQPGTYTVCLQTSGFGIICTPYCQSIQIGGTSNAGHIYGHIYMGNTLADHAVVYLIEYDSNTQMLTAIDTTNLIQTGFYAFTNVPYGDYLVKAAMCPLSPHYWFYLPTYHDSVLYWHQANHVTLNGPSSTAHVYLVAGNNPGGPGFIGGNVTQGANKLLGTGDPIKDVEIMLLDMNDNPIAYTYSDANGDYGIGNLPHGTYKVYAEMINKTTYPIVVTLSAGKDTITEVNIVVNSDAIVAGIENKNPEIPDLLGDFYPNPAINNTYINLFIKQASGMQYIVFDHLGKQLTSTDHMLKPGMNTININTSQLSGGVYFVNFIFDNGLTVNRKFIKLQ